MSSRPRLAVLAVLAAAGAAAGAYFLWPSGRHVAACPPVHEPMPERAQNALDAYAGRIRHTVEHESSGQRREGWADPLMGLTREVVIRPDGRVESAFETIRSGRWMDSVWVLYDARAWMSHRMRVPVGASIGFTAADEAQANRDKVAHGTARVVGKDVVGGRQAIRVHEVLGLGGFALDTWVDPLTYVTLRTRSTLGGATATTDEAWLPRSAANVAKTRLVIPAGFTHPSDLGTAFTSSDQTVTMPSRSCG